MLDAVAVSTPTAESDEVKALAPENISRSCNILSKHVKISISSAKANRTAKDLFDFSERRLFHEETVSVELAWYMYNCKQPRPVYLYTYKTSRIECQVTSWIS